MSPGCYFPPPVRMVEIPTPGGRGVRVLGVASVADRIAQTVAARALEPEVEKIFHPGSCGYRPGKSALDAVGACRERCWRADPVIDLDIKGFSGNLDHDLVLKAVAHHTGQGWVLRHVRPWLKAPRQRPDRTLAARDRGSPQGSAISPLLATLFLPYAFDAWMGREFPGIGVERYCDDVVVHCRSQGQARLVRDAIAKRMAEGGGRQLHPGKTRIVYCKDGRRRGWYEHTSCTFLGDRFRVRKVRTRHGDYFFGFNPALSEEAAKRIRAQARAWRLHLRSGWSLKELAQEVNRTVRGWINYYGRFYPSALGPSLNRIHDYLVRWVVQKYKRYRGTWRPAREALRKAEKLYPLLFAHWKLVKP
jgi:RNA-directed DNA polymerase